MRGKQVSKKLRKLDVVLDAVRYELGTSRLLSARGYKRIGYVWSDILLYDRKELIELVKSKKRLVCGHPAEIEGDFDVFGRVQFEGDEVNGSFTCDSSSENKRENLGLPLF